MQEKSKCDQTRKTAFLTESVGQTWLPPCHNWDRVLAPTLNQRVPFGGLNRLTWEFISANKIPGEQHRTMQSKAEFLISKTFTAAELSTVLEFMTQVHGHLHTAVFERLFRKIKREVHQFWGVDLPRRIVVRVPSYHQEVLDTVTRVVRKAISDVLIPSGFQSWLKKIVNSRASPSPSVASLAKVSRGTAQHRVTDYLQAAQNEVPFATWRPVDDHTDAWLLRLPDSVESPFPALWSFIEQRVRIDVTGQLKPVRTPVAILGSLGVCIYVPASRHWLISYSPIHLI